MPGYLYTVTVMVVRVVRGFLFVLVAFGVTETTTLQVPALANAVTDVLVAVQTRRDVAATDTFTFAPRGIDLSTVRIADDTDIDFLIFNR